MLAIAKSRTQPGWYIIWFCANAQASNAATATATHKGLSLLRHSADLTHGTRSSHCSSHRSICNPRWYSTPQSHTQRSDNRFRVRNLRFAAHGYAPHLLHHFSPPPIADSIYFFRPVTTEPLSMTSKMPRNSREPASVFTWLLQEVQNGNPSTPKVARKPESLIMTAIEIETSHSNYYLATMYTDAKQVTGYKYSELCCMLLNINYKIKV